VIVLGQIYTFCGLVFVVAAGIGAIDNWLHPSGPDIDDEHDFNLEGDVGELWDEARDRDIDYRSEVA
jgi:hypothetical protein